MKKILHNKSLLHRLIALVMSVVMVLTLVAIDSKVHLFAEEEIKTVDITDLLKGDETDMLFGSKEITKYKFASKPVDDVDLSKIVYKSYTDDDPEEKLPTSTDVTKYNSIGTEEAFTNDNKVSKYAFYYVEYNDDGEIENIKFMGKLRAVYDNKNPEIESVELTSNSGNMIVKDGYYLLDVTEDGVALPQFTITVDDGTEETDTGVAKVVYLKKGETTETEIEGTDGKYTFGVPDETGEYIFRVYDKAGNVSADTQPLVIKKLNGAPSISKINLSSSNNKAQKKLINNMEFIVSPETMTVQAEINMSTAGDGDSTVVVGAQLCYRFLSDDNTVDSPETICEVTKNAQGKYVAEFVIPVNSLDKKSLTKMAICVKDEFDNRSCYTDLENHIVFVSDQSPTIDFTKMTQIRGEGYKAKDDNNWVKSMSFVMSANDDYAYIDKMYYKNGGAETVIAQDLNVFSKNAKIGITGTAHPGIDAGSIALEDGQYKLTFGAKDYIGNDGTKDLDVYIDNTAPVLKLSSDAPKVKVGSKKYYSLSKSTDKIDVAWEDATSGVDESATTAVLFNSAISYTLKVNRDEAGKGHVTMSNAVESGEYALEITIYDHAGNKTTESVPVFVNKSDFSAEISAEADAEEIKSGKYVSADKVVVTGTAEGFCLTTDDVDVQVEVDGKVINSDKHLSISNQKNGTVIFTYVISNTKKEDMQGHYKFKMTVRNHGTDVTKTASYSLVYDTTAPNMTAAEVTPYNNKKVKVAWTAKDKEDVKYIEIEGTRTVCVYNKTTGKVDQTEHEISTFRLKGTETSYTFKEDGKYDIDIYAYDAAGNVSDSANVRFVIDRENPVVEYTEKVTDPSAKDNSGQTIEVTVHDSYRIVSSDVTATVYYRTYDGASGTMIGSLKRVNNETIKASMNLKPVGGAASVYRVEVKGNDKAGNAVMDKVDLAKNRYYIDKTKPEVKISPKPESKNDGYYKENVSFDISILEQFNRKHTLTITDANGTAPERTEKFEFNEYMYSPTYRDEGSYDLTIKVTDAAGNSSTVGTKFVIDKTKPTVQLGTVQPLNTGNVTLPVTLRDNMEGSKYTVHVVRTDANGSKVYDADLENGTWTGTDFTKNCTFADEGDYVVTVSAEDKAGNKSDAQISKFRIDRTAPVITISGVNDKQTTTGTATISVDEAFSFDYEGRSLGASDIKVSITKKTDGTGASNIAELTAGSFSGGNPHTASYSFTEDGEYTITANAKDLAGNVAASATKTFKIDSKAPVIKMSVSDKNSKTIKSYDAVGSTDMLDPNYVDMSLSVEETFFRTNNVKITVNKDGKDISASSFTNYSNSSAVSTGSQRFDEDGVYEITVTAQDELGNKTDDYNIVFTVDNTAPTIESTSKLLSLMAKSTAGEDGSVLLNADDFADILNSGYDALWNVNDTSVFDVNVKMDGVDFIDFSDMEDGYHKITLKATDEVGHETSQEFGFTYDGTAPRIIISGVEDGETVREPFDMTIGLENEEDEITSIVINGNTIDPAQYKSNNQYKMHVEEYDSYTIEVTATDKAGNISSTVDEKTGAVFTFKLSEKISSVALILIIIAAILLVALLIFVIIAGRKRKKKSAA